MARRDAANASRCTAIGFADVRRVSESRSVFAVCEYCLTLKNASRIYTSGASGERLQPPGGLNEFVRGRSKSFHVLFRSPRYCFRAQYGYNNTGSDNDETDRKCTLYGVSRDVSSVAVFQRSSNRRYGFGWFFLTARVRIERKK